MSDVMPAEKRFERFLQAWSRKSRFAVEGPKGKFSTAWAAWEHKDTVYFAGRTIGGFIKVSLHPVGGYRLAFTKDYHPKIKHKNELFENRNLAVWPKPNLENKIIALAACVYFPTDYLNSAPPPSSVRKQYLILQTLSPNRMVKIGFFLSHEKISTLKPVLQKIGIPLCRWEFSDGSSISMVAAEEPFHPSILPTGIPVNGIDFTNLKKLKTNQRSDLTSLMWNEPGPNSPLQLLEIGGVSLS